MPGVINFREHPSSVGTGRNEDFHSDGAIIHNRECVNIHMNTN